MRRHFVRPLGVFVAAMFVLLAASLSVAQERQEYSDKDKKKMAEIAERPEVKAKIEEAWATLRRTDMQYAYTVNMATRMEQFTPADLAEFHNKYGQLYDNPVLVRYVNGVGQKLVPPNSANVYAFRLLLDPVPRAEALTTGTIYVSTGLVSLLDNEAQLAYVLGHEIAHVERNHAYNQIRNQVLEEELDVEKEKSAEHKRALIGAMGAVGGGLIGKFAGGGAALGAIVGGIGSYEVSKLFVRNRFQPTEWSTVFEDEADAAGLQYVLQQNYDAREVPRLYARLDNLVSRDKRVGLGFIGSPERTKERSAKIQSLLTTTYKNDLEQKIKAAGLVGSSPEFSLLMASLKRDNGVVALDYDLFAMARDNLEEAARLRSNDPRVYYYLGQVVALTGRSPDDKKAAMEHFAHAIKLDEQRGFYAGPHLERALYLISQNRPADQDVIKKELKTYVSLYQRQHGGALPNNMYIIYDYFSLAGEDSWYVPPASVVSTKDVDPLNVSSSTSSAGEVKKVLDPVKTVPRRSPGN
jgi:predicted Zn-dependent protease